MGEAVNNTRSETTVTDNALIGISDHSTNRNTHEIAKSTTIDSIYVDANSDSIDDIDDPSSYKEVRAHHLHSWKCDDNSPLVLPSENPTQESVPLNNSSGNLNLGGTFSSSLNDMNCIHLFLGLLQKINLTFLLRMQMILVYKTLSN